ncbi:hypothetical protein EZS27_040175, partial [termite gut metagenome]
MDANEKETIGKEELQEKEQVTADENVSDNAILDNEENTGETTNEEELEIP